MAFALNTVEKEAPWRWLAQGWADLWKAPGLSLGIGVLFVAIGFVIIAGLWALGMLAVAPVLLSGFALVAPAFAVGFYQISRLLDRGEPPSLPGVASLSGSKISQIGFLSVLLIILFLAWARIAQFLYAGFVQGDYTPLADFSRFVLTDPAGMGLLAIGTLVGAALALVAFAISVLSFPMLVDRDVDAITALITSVKAVIKQPFVMLVWAWLIAFMVVIGTVTVIGLALVFPWLGHASWRAYQSFVPPAGN
ncbi:MAG: DUF2189 domain-containing protein [Maricaulaceae bacterium]|nr:DUF2189 domain-containing protein [Maricaulaceae bacterium]